MTGYGTRKLQDLMDSSPRGEYVEVGFRPSGELHVGNLLTIGYAAAIADKLSKKLRVTCCDTDFSANIHKRHMRDNNRVMRLFFMEQCPCGDHKNVAQHRMDGIQPFLDELELRFGVDIERRFLTGLQGNEEYVGGLRTVLKNMEEFDSFYGGGFRRRFISPVAAVCEECGYSHAKGGSYSPGTDEVVAPCRNLECSSGFASEPLGGEIGVYYLVDPVRDAIESTAVHVFGGDYSVAQKEQKTSKLAKVSKTTEMVGESPDYFLAPTVVSGDGKALTKSKSGGKRTSELDLKDFGSRIASELSDWILEEKIHVKESEI